jgi:hypothetical protein
VIVPEIVDGARPVAANAGSDPREAPGTL